MKRLPRFGSLIHSLVSLGLVAALPGAAGAATIMLNDGMSHTFDDGTHSDDFVYVRNVGCPPGWPAGNPWEGCPSPGAATEVTLTDGGEVDGLLTQDSSTLTMSGGTVGLGLVAYDSSTIAIVGSDFAVDGGPVPYGDLTAQTGTLTGKLASGDPIDNVFHQRGCMSCRMRPCTGTITLVSSMAFLHQLAPPSTSTLVETVVSKQPTLNSEFTGDFEGILSFTNLENLTGGE